ncbi:LysR family transcriptional regulator [Parageobacillus thermoglucosidasius]|uniref:LysR family transcriptional regulator n=1 Tax=Parageobacillus thermoglucosidasius TaxID=1426 RepID=UPI000E16D43F|nr:LysR family transcriptional regulator [Parageobacillus thermoglucosidasius]MED4905747.1 LysR family transcriptional regulator [Parageobacillus thermoglucosidasius]MED4914872.1 LysR family transcriptional regulator [Parageobacillus thermoglucosidasius]MED4943695.1 LysR family transcriptional regulator [Parageobacillus thermoglucosidasius]MED4984155.1 LysR family transcriptional regulator [Parageobacillus thermoglucosidasius]RDE29719.1 LysR family transcriptional regulator [Parageobacillus th
MDLRTIKTFKTVVKYGSFQRAAEELNYAQSTVTTHIKNLEDELGVTLLKRGKTLQLTEAGRLLSEKGEFLLKGFENLQSSLQELVQGESGIIRIGVMEPTASYRLPPLLASFRKKYPKIQLNIQIHSSQSLVEMVMKDEVDLAICPAPETATNTVFDPLFSEEVVLLVPVEHHLSQKETIYLENLKNEQLLMTSSSCPFRNNLEKKMIELGINPVYGIEISNMLALKHYVQSSLGIAVVPRITVNNPPEGTVIKPIADFRKGLTVGILRNSERFYNNKSIERLMDVLYANLAGSREKQDL